MTAHRGPRHDELPLPDYDHLPVSSLEARIRSPEPEQVQQLLAYEREHGERLPVLQALEQRLRALESGAEPTEGSPTAMVPETEPGPPAASKISPQTGRPPVNPPSNGVPINPQQPRGGDGPAPGT